MKKDRQRVTMPPKFKGVCPVTGKEGYTFFLETHRDIRDNHMPTHWAVTKKYVHSPSVESKPVILQSTGVFDSKGREIHVGDVVETYDHHTGETNLFEVGFRLGGVWLVPHELNPDAVSSILEVALCDKYISLSVVGNRYTPHDLLK